MYGLPAGETWQATCNERFQAVGYNLMITIVLLDSDNDARMTLAAAMATFQPEWTIHAVGTGTQALQLVRQEAVDVVITETHLSDTTGFEFLGQVLLADDNVIRLTHSADLDAEIILESARANHRFIAKPAVTRQLVTSIESSLKLRSLLTCESLLASVGNITSIPALPAIYEEMMSELASRNSTMGKLSDIVEGDAGLTVTVLKIVNSAFYGISRRVESVAQAVTLLGVHLIKNITLTAKVFSRFEGSEISVKRLTELNNEAIKVGALSNQFARYAKLSKGIVDHCQIAGMLCNIGTLIAISKIEDTTETTPVPNSILGAYVLRQWMMPDAIVEAIALQYEPQPQCVDTISPRAILHTIRYLQEHYTDTAQQEQRLLCNEYLCHHVSESVAADWLDAYEAMGQLNATGSRRVA